MYTQQDEYLNQLEERANKLLQGSSDEEETLVSNSSGRNSRLREVTQRDWVNGKGESPQTQHKSSNIYPRQSRMYDNSHMPEEKEMAVLKTELDRLRRENQLLKAENKLTTQQHRDRNIIEEQISKFKREVKGQMESKLKREMQVWIRRIKDSQVQREHDKQRLQGRLRMKDQEIEEMAEEKKRLVRRIKKLNGFILERVPEITSTIKANSILLESCIGSFQHN